MFVEKGVPPFLDFSEDPWLDQSTPEEAQENNKLTLPVLFPDQHFTGLGMRQPHTISIVTDLPLTLQS